MALQVLEAQGPIREDILARKIGLARLVSEAGTRTVGASDREIRIGGIAEVFKFLHAADIHLDSPLHGLDRYEGAPSEQLRSATRRALENLATVAIREQVAFVVLAGDLYDGDWPDFNTGLFFVGQMARLREAGIRVFGVFGNHDAANRITRTLPLPENVRFFPTDAPTTIRLEDLGVAIHGQSFAQQCTTADLTQDYPAAVGGCFNLGILHTSMSGREGHANYAPCSEASLRDRGYDYWALGHIHQREVLPGPTVIAYPGNIQGRHIRETGPKGCLLIEVQDQQAQDPIFEPLDVLRWEVADVELTGVETKEEALTRIGDRLRQVLERADGRLVAVRVRLLGQTPIAETFAADRRQLMAEIRAIGIDVGADNLWLEKVKNETTLPVKETSLEEGTPRAEVAYLVEELTASVTVGADVGIDLSDLRQKISSELPDLIRADDSAWWQELLREAESRLMMELRGGLSED